MCVCSFVYLIPVLFRPLLWWLCDAQIADCFSQSWQADYSSYTDVGFVIVVITSTDCAVRMCLCFLIERIKVNCLFITSHSSTISRINFSMDAEASEFLCGHWWYCLIQLSIILSNLTFKCRCVNVLLQKNCFLMTPLLTVIRHSYACRHTDRTTKTLFWHVDLCRTAQTMAKPMYSICQEFGWWPHESYYWHHPSNQRYWFELNCCSLDYNNKKKSE